GWCERWRLRMGTREWELCSGRCPSERPCDAGQVAEYRVEFARRSAAVAAAGAVGAIVSPASAAGVPEATATPTIPTPSPLTSRHGRDWYTQIFSSARFNASEQRAVGVEADEVIVARFKERLAGELALHTLIGAGEDGALAVRFPAQAFPWVLRPATQDRG